MSVWQSTIPTEGDVELPPDPRSLHALGRNHSLATALADLVDNSIDAHARQILIRFVQHDGRLTGLYVLDDGHGIAPEAIDAAMTIGGNREYTETDLGHFGLGLKAASFSQAGSLTVLSRAAGTTPVGRRWLLHSDRSAFRCDKIPTDFAADELDRDWPFSLGTSGTVVRWDQVRGFPTHTDPAQINEFLQRTINEVQSHLGLMFHRILAAGTVTVTVDVEEIGHGTGVPNPVAPLDPFAYPTTPPGWPKDLVAHVDDSVFVLRCHLWPRKSSRPEFRLPGGAEARQGLYFYRRDRLLHAGGWEGIHAADRTLQLARVAVDIDGDIAGLFSMNPEKSRVSSGPHFAAAVAAARAEDGTTIADYLHAAATTWATANQRAVALRAAVTPPGRGLHPRVVGEIRDELPQLPKEPVSILWKPLPDDRLFEVDRDAATLWLNQSYRRALLGGRRGGLNDLPLLKATLFLLIQQVFQGVHLGARDKDNIMLWQEILTTAAKAERATFEARP